MPVILVGYQETFVSITRMLVRLLPFKTTAVVPNIIEDAGFACTYVITVFSVMPVIHFFYQETFVSDARMSVLIIIIRIVRIPPNGFIVDKRRFNVGVTLPADRNDSATDNIAFFVCISCSESFIVNRAAKRSFIC